MPKYKCSCVQVIETSKDTTTLERRQEGW